MKKPDKYADLKATILKIFKESKETYGYRRIWLKLKRLGYNYCLDTIRRLTGVLNIKVNLYSKHHSKYSSYKGRTGIVADNILKQKFNQTVPYRVLHTDVTQVKLSNSQWGYISSITDEASREIIGISVKCPLIVRH
jgi:putative transposase